MAFAGLHRFLGSTRLGKTIRAVSQNTEAALVVGIDVARVRTVTFALSGALAGLAALLIGPIYPVYPLVGVILVLKAFAIVIMGGLGSVEGAIAGASSVPASYLWWALGYTVLYSSAAMLLALIFFEDRDLA